MAQHRAPRFTAYVAFLFVLLGAIQLVASLTFYQAIDRQTLRDDHARRIAELLVVSDRLYAAMPDRTPRMMSTRYLTATIADQPVRSGRATDVELARIADMITSWEPSLARRDLRLAMDRRSARRSDLIGSIRLPAGRWLNFRSADIMSTWPIVSRAFVITLASAAACMLVGLFALHKLGKPLRQLTQAAEALGHGRAVSVPEEGLRDLRELAHAMNTMQARIFHLLRDQAKSFEAISHDLRTPLSRQKIAAELIEDQELAAIMVANVDEMEELLASLQVFLRAQRIVADAEAVDLGGLVQSAVAPFGDRISLVVPAGAITVTTFLEPLSLALAALIDNALRFGEHVTVAISRSGEGRYEIAVEDDGPGIDPRHFEDIRDPFFRLDEARQRDTKGFGLGIPTANLLMMRFNGALSFDRAAGGGLIARIVVPGP